MNIFEQIIAALASLFGAAPQPKTTSTGLVIYPANGVDPINPGRPAARTIPRELYDIGPVNIGSTTPASSTPTDYGSFFANLFGPSVNVLNGPVAGNVRRPLVATSNTGDDTPGGLNDIGLTTTAHVDDWWSNQNPNGGTQVTTGGTKPSVGEPGGQIQIVLNPPPPQQ